MEEDGLLMSINMKSKFDYEAIYLSGGKVHYIFNAGSGSLTLSSKTKVNDGRWHKLVARRNRRSGNDELFYTPVSLTLKSLLAWG